MMTIWNNYPFEDAVAVLFDFGRVSSDLLIKKNSTTDLEKVWSKFGIRLVMCDIMEMMESFKLDMAAVEALAWKWEQEANHVAEGIDYPIRSNAKLFLAMDHVLSKEKGNAAAINCHALPGYSFNLPCVAMVKLYQRGILAACEMDINGMLSSMLLTHLSKCPAFMGNVLPRSKDTFDIEHCVAPPEMLPELGGCSLENYHGRTDHATVSVALPYHGTVTLARIAPDLEHIHFVTGKIEAVHHTGKCRNSITIRVDDCEKFMKEKLFCHYALVYGDVSKELSNLKNLKRY